MLSKVPVARGSLSVRHWLLLPGVPVPVVSPPTPLSCHLGVPWWIPPRLSGESAENPGLQQCVPAAWPLGANDCCPRVLADKPMLLPEAVDLPTAAFLSVVLCKNDVGKHKVILVATLEPLDVITADVRADPPLPQLLFFSFCYLQSRVVSKGQEDGSKGKGTCHPA